MNRFLNAIKPYCIEVFGVSMQAIPMEDGAYRVLSGTEILTDIFPEITAAGIYWNAFGHISVGLAEEIGEQIDACEI